MAYFLKHIHDNLWQGKFSIFPEDIAVHAISTRLGGVSQPPYDSLDLLDAPWRREPAAV